MFDSQARFLSRFTRASSGGKSGGSERGGGDTGQAGTAAGHAEKQDDDQVAAKSVDELAEGDEQAGTTEVVEVDPAQLDRPEGAVGADAPGPEDADAGAAMQTDQEVDALAKAAQAEPPQASAAPARAGPSARTAKTRAASRQAGSRAADVEPAQTGGDKANNKQSRAADKKRRKATGAAAGCRVTRARADATAAIEPAEAAVPARSQRARPSSRRRGTAVEPDSGPITSEGAAGQRDSSPAASSDCVLLGEGREPEQHSVADSMPDPQSSRLAGAPPPGGQQKEGSSHAAIEAPSQHGAEDADQMRAPPVSDSEHSSAMAVEPRFTGDNDVSSGAQQADVAGPSVGAHEAAAHGPAAVQQVTRSVICLIESASRR